MAGRTLLVVVASFLAAGCHSEEITGNLFARGGALGDWALDPYVCLSGEPAGWKGVDLLGSDTSVRLRIHPREGALVIAYRPREHEPHVFSPARCEWFGATFEQTNTYVEEVRVVNGEIDIDCETDAGTLYGHVAFEGCH
jgi:hypothetical protein